MSEEQCSNCLSMSYKKIGEDDVKNPIYECNECENLWKALIEIPKEPRDE